MRELLHCERGNVYLLDSQPDELWSVKQRRYRGENHTASQRCRTAWPCRGRLESG